MNDIYTFYGLYRGVVKDNDDSGEEPPNLGRVKVYVPQVYGADIKDEDLPWAEPCFLLGGGRRWDDPEAPAEERYSLGFIAIPPIKAAVWIMFEQGDPNHPVWMGTWYGTRDGSPEMPEQATEGYPDTILLKDSTAKDGMFIRWLRDDRLEIRARTVDKLAVCANEDCDYAALNNDGSIDISTDVCPEDGGALKDEEVEGGNTVTVKRDGSIEVASSYEPITIRSTKGSVLISSGSAANETLQSIEIDHDNQAVRIAAKELDIQADNMLLTVAEKLTVRALEHAKLMTPHATGFDHHTPP